MIPGVILILCGLFFNHWILSPFLHLDSGEVSIVRITCACILDITCIAAGIILIIKNKRSFPSTKKAVFAGIIILLILLVTEGFLQLAARLSPQVNRILSPDATAPSIPYRLADPLLGYRGHPGFPGHDSNGFRNKKSLTNADIVTIGDSQTYGTGVSCDQSWPQQLSDCSGMSVYNMSLGGYGSIQALLLMKATVFQLNPKIILFMLYDGNDFIDAYDAVYNHGLCNALRSTDPEILKAIDLPEEKNPLIPKVNEITSQLWSDKLVKSTRPKNGDGVLKKLKLVQLFVSLQEAVATAISSKRVYAQPRIAQQVTDPNFIYFVPFDCRDFKTTFTPHYRNLAMDLQDARVREGQRLTLEAIREMKNLADSDSKHFWVLLLPTKEKAFYDLYKQYNMDPSKAVQSTVRFNDEVRNVTIDYFQQHEIPYIDTLPILHKCFKQKQQPFFENADGHLNHIGHQAVAQAVYECIEKNQ